MNKSKKIIIGILIASVIVISIFVTYKLIEKSVTDREDFNFRIENINSNPVNTVSH